MTPQEVQERLKLNQLKDKIWYVVPSCATTGEGLFEGLVRWYPSGCPFDDLLKLRRAGFQTMSRPRRNDRIDRHFRPPVTNQPTCNELLICTTPFLQDTPNLHVLTPMACLLWYLSEIWNCNTNHRVWLFANLVPAFVGILLTYYPSWACRAGVFQASLSLIIKI